MKKDNYLRVINSHPHLFDNENALLNIVFDPKIISEPKEKMS
jgi:hypothetical protein